MVAKYKPSKLASSALKLSIKIMGEAHEKELTGDIVSCLSYKQTEILACYLDLLSVLAQKSRTEPSSRSYSSLHRKYNLSMYVEILRAN